MTGEYVPYFDWLRLRCMVIFCLLHWRIRIYVTIPNANGNWILWFYMCMIPSLSHAQRIGQFKFLATTKHLSASISIQTQQHTHSHIIALLLMYFIFFFLFSIKIFNIRHNNITAMFKLKHTTKFIGIQISFMLAMWYKNPFYFYEIRAHAHTHKYFGI